MSRLNLENIRQKAENLRDNEKVNQFLEEANGQEVVEITTATDRDNFDDQQSKVTVSSTNRNSKKKKRRSASQKKIYIDGRLENRDLNCGKPTQVYLINSLKDWINENVAKGPGGVQTAINYLIHRGIEAVEKDFTRSGRQDVDIVSILEDNED